ncbi:hypothetical protein FQA39_LY16164 [Lamprigera yunnana]|nr:hypothetical protein FQA39_LY16164 [Lamprigera yunnana]
MISNGTLERCISYEAIAKFLIFPCYNQKNGCDVNLKCTEVVAHEMSCKAQLVQCAFQLELGQTRCAWNGPSKDFAPHLHAMHKEKLQIGLPTSFINIKVTHINLFFTVIDNHTFLLIAKYDKDLNKFFYLVLCCESYPINQCYRYQLELGRCNDYFLILRKPEPESMGNIQEMLNNNEKVITVDVASILNMLNDPNGIIHYKLLILKKNKKEITTIMGTVPTVPKVNSRSKSRSKNKKKSKPGASNKNVQTPLQVVNTQKTEANLAKLKLGETSGQIKGHTLGELECPICNEYMSTPIFICPTGHSICNICTPKLQHCPLCQQSMQNTRNFTLEKLAETLKFPCCYNSQGCNVNLLLQHLKIHELHCTFAYGRCPLKLIISCADNDIIDIIGHLRKKHPTYIAEANHRYSHDIVGGKTTSYWVNIHQNEIFIICCKHGNKTAPIRFNVLHVSPNKNQSKYKFEIYFCDQTGNRLQLVISDICKLFPLIPSTAFTKCLMIPLDLLQPYINKATKVQRLFFNYPINQCYRYQLELGRCNDYFLILRKPELESMGNIQEMLNDNEKVITVDVASILNMLNDPNGIIHYKLSILKKNKKEITTIMGKVPTVPKVNSLSKSKSKAGANNINMPTPLEVVNTQKTEANLAKLKLGETSGQIKGHTLGELECPICNEYMSTPIFICPTGHSICNTCTTNLQHCPLCRQTMQNTRNFTLENLAETLTFLCCYKEQGCNVNLIPQHLKIHELHCTFAYGRCPLKLIISCPDNDIIDIIGHLRQKHPTYIVEANQRYSRDITGEKTTSYWVTIYQNEIFIICCKHSNTTAPIKFNVLHVSTNKNQSKYKFEIYFCDQTGNRLLLVISDVCNLFPLKPSTAFTKCLMIPLDLLQPYINKATKVPKLSFKFVIEKL